MFNNNFPLVLIRIIRSYLENRSFSVKCGNSLSERYPITSGVPQGGVLSPTLYNLFVSDIPIPSDTKMFLYADDTAITTCHIDPKNIKTSLEHSFDCLQNYFMNWKIRVNEEKTQSMFFTRRRNRRFLPSGPIKLNGKLINWAIQLKYLGLTLDAKLTFKQHIDITVEKASKRIKMLYPLINRKSKLNFKNKLIVYKTILRPTVVYGSPVWGSCAKTHRIKCQLYQNKMLKMILNLPPWHNTDYVHKTCDIHYINDFISICSDKFNRSCQLSSNPLINTISIDTRT